jgi:thiol-disulfide isomerase/thioredoxin
MKKTLMLVIVIIITGLITFLIIGIIAKTNKGKIAKEMIKTLPVFSLKTLNDTVFWSDQIKEGPVLVLFFHPECEHCQYEIKTLFKNRHETPGIRVLLISNAEKEAIRNFLKENNLLDYPGLSTLIDESFSFRDYFGTELVPATFIYDKKLKLVRYFQGEVRPETILKYLRQDD